jgi:hypothetical protein
MAQPRPTLEQLYRDLHRTEAELLAARARRVGTKWWNRRVGKTKLLRAEIDSVVRHKAATRRWYDPIP